MTDAYLYALLAAAGLRDAYESVSTRCWVWFAYRGGWVTCEVVTLLAIAAASAWVLA